MKLVCLHIVQDSDEEMSFAFFWAYSSNLFVVAIYIEKDYCSHWGSVQLYRKWILGSPFDDGDMKYIYILHDEIEFAVINIYVEFPSCCHICFCESDFG